MSSGKKIFFENLDSIRFFAAMMVFFQHAVKPTFENLDLLQNTQFLKFLNVICDGGTGVSVFFVLSGFVLYPQLLKVIDKKSNLFIFYKRRWIRTLPLYFITLILISILTNHMFDVNFFKYLFLIQKFLPNFIDNDYFPVAWSLSIEE